MGIPVTSLCHYVYGEAETADKCPPEKAEKGLFTIVRYLVNNVRRNNFGAFLTSTVSVGG